MKIDVSEKSGGFIKPLIRKGYYPARVISIEARKDGEGNLFEKSFKDTIAHSMIVKFQIWEVDNAGNAIKPLITTTKIEDGPKIEQEVELASFLNYEYKKKEEDEFRTAFTPTSKITLFFKALGWKFNASKPIDTDDFIGAWAEVNVDDYISPNAEEGTKKQSVIKDVAEYEGEIPKGVTNPSQNQSENKDNYKDSVSEEFDIEEIDMTEDKFEIPEDLQKKLDVLEEQVDAGIITKEGFAKIKSDMIKKAKSDK